MKVSKFFIPFIVVLGITAFQSIFIVQEINQAIVLQFGDPKKIVNKSGLNFKRFFFDIILFCKKDIGMLIAKILYERFIPKLLQSIFMFGI